jgi:hypothetical protein
MKKPELNLSAVAAAVRASGLSAADLARSLRVRPNIQPETIVVDDADAPSDESAIERVRAWFSGGAIGSGVKKP